MAEYDDRVQEALLGLRASKPPIARIEDVILAVIGLLKERDPELVRRNAVQAASAALSIACAVGGAPLADDVRRRARAVVDHRASEDERSESRPSGRVEALLAAAGMICRDIDPGGESLVESLAIVLADAREIFEHAESAGAARER